jgi:hypothetical protein
MKCADRATFGNNETKIGTSFGRKRLASTRRTGRDAGKRDAREKIDVLESGHHSSNAAMLLMTVLAVAPACAEQGFDNVAGS